MSYHVKCEHIQTEYKAIQELFPQLSTVPLVFNGRLKRVVGRCRWRRSTGKLLDIQLSKSFTVACSVNDMIGVLMHEVGHALDIVSRGYSAHDTAFKSICLTLPHPNMSFYYNCTVPTHMTIQHYMYHNNATLERTCALYGVMDMQSIKNKLMKG